MPRTLSRSLGQKLGLALLPGHIQLALGEVLGAAQSQVLLRPPATALGVGWATDAGHRTVGSVLHDGGRGLSPLNNLHTTVQFCGTPLPLKPIWGQVPLGKGAWPRS